MRKKKRKGLVKGRDLGARLGKGGGRERSHTTRPSLVCALRTHKSSQVPTLHTHTPTCTHKALADCGAASQEQEHQEHESEHDQETRKTKTKKRPSEEGARKVPQSAKKNDMKK